MHVNPSSIDEYIEPPQADYIKKAMQKRPPAGDRHRLHGLIFSLDQNLLIFLFHPKNS